jgi:Serine carboxypeptidase
MGGENVSLAIDYPDKTAFKAAGYQDIRVNDSYIGGQVRQHGNFSFTRVYQAGHLIPSYQPETAFVLFDRVIRGVSLATGEDIQTSAPNIYSTTGESSSTTRLTPPPPPPPVCFVRDVQTCTVRQMFMIAGGKGAIINGVLYNSADEYVDPPPTEERNSSGSGRHQGGLGNSTGGGTGEDINEGSGAMLNSHRSSLLAMALALICAVVI